jgi:hypothetical protein
MLKSQNIQMTYTFPKLAVLEAYNRELPDRLYAFAARFLVRRTAGFNSSMNLLREFRGRAENLNGK